MGKKITKKQHKAGTLLILAVNLLTLLGYIILYPFEQFYSYLAVTVPKVINAAKSVRFDMSFIKKFSNKSKDFITRNTSNFYKDISQTTKNFKKTMLLLFYKPKVKKRGRPVKLATKGVSVKKTMLNVNENTFRRKFKIVGAFFLGIIFTFLFVFVPVSAHSWYKQLPQPELLEQQGRNSATKILDRKGRVLYEIYVDRKYDPVPLSKIPDHVINATIAIEDKTFYSHYGFNVLSMVRAAKSTLVNDELQGASTITQQLIKNVLLTPERTISRKVRELALSLMVEQKYSKNEILELYLNNIPYGGTAYGVQSAAQKYFGKDVWDLDLAEASVLAGLPSAPTSYSPVQGNYELAKLRQRQVLLRMVEENYITSAEADEAFEKELIFAPQVEYIRAPHFVAFVRDELYKKYGQRTVDFGGLIITTTLDLDIQEQVQQIVSEEVAASEALKISNGAAIVLDSRSGGILAYVGSIDYFSENAGNYDVVRAYRQPGSSIKPVTYALALEKGYTAASVIDDSPITYQSYGQVYSPRNYDNKFRGNVTLRQALANSYNIPAVKLVNAAGVDNMVQLGINLGIANWRVGDGTYGLAVTLGGKETRLIDLTNIYATFSRGGVYKEPAPFISIKDNYGFELYTVRKDNGTQVIKPETAYILTSILSDDGARSAAFGPNSKLVVPGHAVAVKTGTTNDIRDNLTLGYTPSYTVGVWVGNNDNSPMSAVASGVSGAAPMWNSIMTLLLDGRNDEPFIVPHGIVIKADASCGRVEVFDESNPIPSTLCPPKKPAKESKDDDKERGNSENNRRR